jgi:CBS domain-containing protein
MKTVRDVLAKKGCEVLSVAPHTTVYEALALMADRNIGAVVVLDADSPVGIFSEREYARQVILKGKSSKETPVREVMLAPVLFVRPEQTIESCMGLMTDRRVRHLPVLDDDGLTGIVSIGDIVKAIIDDREFHIEQLQQYITSGG